MVDVAPQLPDGSMVQANQLGPEVGSRLALVLHSSNELSELLQCQCRDGSTINIVVRYYCCY